MHADVSYRYDSERYLNEPIKKDEDGTWRPVDPQEAITGELWEPWNLDWHKKLDQIYWRGQSNMLGHGNV